MSHSLPIPEPTSHFHGKPAPTPVELAVIVPMYREAKRIGPTLRDLVATLPRFATSWEIILVDDGSPDDTLGVVGEVSQSLSELSVAGVLPIRIVRHPRNRGKGAAVRTGLAHAHAAWSLVMDADNACSVQEVGPLLALARSSPNVGLVSGSRRVQGANVKAVAQRQLAGAIFRGVLHTLGLALLSDTQCGFKLYRGDLSRHIARQGVVDGYAFDLEHLLLTKRAGLQIAELGVRWDHQDGGQVSPIRDGLKMTISATRLRLHWLFRPPAMPDLSRIALAKEMIEVKPAEVVAPGPGQVSRSR